VTKVAPILRLLVGRFQADRADAPRRVRQQNDIVARAVPRGQQRHSWLLAFAEDASLPLRCRQRGVKRRVAEETAEVVEQNHSFAGVRYGGNRLAHLGVVKTVDGASEFTPEGDPREQVRQPIPSPRP